MKLVLDFVFITAFLLNTLILFLLAKNSSKELHKRILQIIFVFIAFSICSVYAYLHKIRILFYTTFIFDQSITTFIGPLLLLYVKSIFLPSKGLLKKNSIHFIFPFLCLCIITIPSLIATYNKVYIFAYIAKYENYFPLIILYSLVYCSIALRVLQKAKEVIKHNYSNVEHMDLTWIKRLLIGTIVIINVDVLSTLYELWFGKLEWNTFYLTAIGVVILVIYLGYYGILQTKVLIPAFLLAQVEESHDINISKTENPEKTKPVLPYQYSESELDELEQSLNTIMKEQKPFLDENLSLNSLAAFLSISDKKLSTLLNQHMQVSFYDYVNGFRVEDVIDKLKNPSYDKFTLLAIAFESGFNSKTSFNRIFKKVTGISPSQYKKQLK